MKPPGGVTPTQPSTEPTTQASTYSVLGRSKEKVKEGRDYQQLDCKKEKREEKFNNHRNPLPPMEEYRTLEMVSS